MLLRDRLLDTEEKTPVKDLNVQHSEEVSLDVLEKGFSLYNWISLEELRQTVMVDYLLILSKITIPFSFIFIVVGVINFYMYRETGVLSFWFLYVLLGGYILTFFIVILKMFYRSWIFMKITNVFFTSTHLGVGGKIINLENYQDEKSVLDDYGDLFHERLGQKSTLIKRTESLKDELFSSKGKEDKFNFFDISDLGNLGKEVALLGLVIVLLLGAYWVSLYFFYALGFLISWSLSYLFIGIIRLIKSIFITKEEKINALFKSLSSTSRKLQETGEESTRLIARNLAGDWTEKNSTLIKSLNTTMTQVRYGLQESKKIHETLQSSKYNNIFDFQVFHKWINIQITQPTKEMLKLLIETNETVDKQMTMLSRKILNTTNEKEIAQYQLQLERLRIVRTNINNQIVNWTQMLETLQTQVFEKLHK